MGSVTVNVPETPGITLLDGLLVRPQWSKWFSSLGTWVREASKPGTLAISLGTCVASRAGSMVNITATIPAGTYANTPITGFVPAFTKTPCLAMGSVVGLCTIDTEGVMKLTISSTSEILISAVYSAGKE